LLLAALDADEDVPEVVVAHEAEELLLSREVHGGLGAEVERVTVGAAPRGHRREHLFGATDVADEVVIADVDHAPVAEVVEHLELLHDLRWRLGAGLPSENFHLRAELAAERASAGEPEAYEQVLVQPCEVVAGYDGSGEVGQLGRPIDAGADPRAEIIEEPREHALGLAHHDEVRVVGEELG